MADIARNQDDTLCVVALNITSGKVNPDQWKGLRRVDEDDPAVLDILREIREWGYGKMEVNVIAHRLDTVHKSETFKRKDLVKESPGT